MNKYLEKIASQKGHAVIITGNPKYLNDGRVKAHAGKLYSDLETILRGRGYRVTFDEGREYTSPDSSAAVWVGHSRGIDRLRFAPEGVKTIALETNDNSKTYKNNDERGLDPDHYLLSQTDLNRLNAL